MSLGQTNSFDATTAGLKFTRPGVTLTSQNMAINGGLSFDLPLASLTMSQNKAVDFMSANAAAIGGALERQAVIGGNSIDITIAGSGAMATALSTKSMDSLFNINSLAMRTAENIYGMGIQQQRYVARKNSKRCFITTAVCAADNKADDCEELQTLRKWRDNVLITMPAGESLISIYYMIAPPALEKIAQKKEAALILSTIRERFLLPAIDAINAGQHWTAYALYCSVVAFTLEMAEG